MAFFYVKAGGTRTTGGGDVTKRTGPWNASTGDYYDTIGDCLADGVVAGDVICWSSASSDTIPGSTTYQIPGNVSLLVVNDVNQDVYVKAVTDLITQTSGDRITLQNAPVIPDRALIKGARITTDDTFEFAATSGIAVHLDCDYVLGTSAWKSFAIGGTSTSTTYICTNIYCQPLQNHRMSLNTWGDAIFYGGRFDSGYVRAYEMKGARSHALVHGQDMSNSPDNTVLLELPSSISGDLALVRYVNCSLPSGWTITNTITAIQNGGVVQSCDSAHQYVYEARAGIVDFVVDVYHDDSTTLSDGVTKGSYEFETNDQTSKSSPLFIAPPSFIEQMTAENKEAATKTKVRMYLATESGDTIDDGDIAFIVFSPKSVLTYNDDCTFHWKTEVEPTSALTTQTGKWTVTRGGFTLGAQYLFDIDMGNPGNGVVKVIPGITKPNITVFISWQLEFVT